MLEVEAMVSTPAAPELHAMPARIMIVEDERLVAAALAARLEADGYQVVANVGTGEQAVEKAKALAPDLILMDVNLGAGIDGIEATRQIQAERDTAVVFLTAYSDESTMQRAGQMLPFSYLIKPVQDRQLRPVIEMALYRHRMEREREELIARLQASMCEIERLRSFLPVCAWCRKVRTDDGYYKDLVDYLRDTFGTQMTHGICEDCEAKLGI